LQTFNDECESAPPNCQGINSTLVMTKIFCRKEFVQAHICSSKQPYHTTCVSLLSCMLCESPDIAGAACSAEYQTQQLSSCAFFANPHPISAHLHHLYK
jgi:hypothetical protein